MVLTRLSIAFPQIWPEFAVHNRQAYLLCLMDKFKWCKGLLRVRFGKTETHLHCNTVSLLTSLTFPENFSIIFSAADARHQFWQLNRHRSLKLQIRYAFLF